MEARLDQMFITTLGISYGSEGDLIVGDLPLTDDVRVPGTRLVRAGVLATAADVVSGWSANVAVSPRIPLTVDLTVVRLRYFDADAVHLVSRVLRAGRTTVVAEVLITPVGSAEPAVLSHVTFTMSPRPEDVMEMILGQRSTEHTLARPIFDEIGARLVGPGVAELDRVPWVMQPAGTIQGGAVALMAEMAAESVAGVPVGDLEIRYLSAVRVGPARAGAAMLAPGLVRVEVRDIGNADRLAAVVLART